MNSVDDCEGEDHCENGGTCVNRIGSYECYCATGYEGRSCEVGKRCFTKNIVCNVYQIYRCSLHCYIIKKITIDLGSTA